MSELRFNRVTGDWVIVTTDRAAQPEDFIRPGTPRDIPGYVASCSFCPGNEAATETVYSEPSGANWSVRIIRNPLPALQPDSDHGLAGGQMNRRIRGFGYHEIVIETPEHNKFLWNRPAEEIRSVLSAMKGRYLAIAEDERVALVVLYKNHGSGAGSSVEHPHCQILATPVVPNDVRRRSVDALRYFDENGQCMFCAMIREELAEGQRIVHLSENFVSFLPFAAASPFHIWMMPLRHSPDFGWTMNGEIMDLAEHLRVLLRKICLGLNNPDFNFVIRSMVQRYSDLRSFHWYLSIVPRVSLPAGFELGSGMFINAGVPEKSAEFLRNVKSD
jgi:UDPglucose--hexose-1-phosphate uridylyltransferase